MIARVLFAAFFTGSVVLAAPGQSVTSLSLSEAREIAIKNHPQISAADLIALASRQDVRAAQSVYYPHIVANATAVDATADNTRVAAGGLNNPLILSRNAEGVDVTQIITDFGRSINLSASSKLHAHAQAQAAVATRAEILLALDAAYFDALSAQSVLQVARQTVATRQFTDDQIKELATNKLRSALDVSFADVNLGEARLLLAGAQKDLESAFERLSNLLGERERRSYALMDQPTNGLPAEDDVELVQTALRNRPDVMQLRYERDAAEKFARAEQGLNYPTISAVGSAGILPVHDPVMRNNYAAAGVNLSLPIFDGFLFSARKEEADLKARAAAEEVRNIEDNVIRDVRVALLNLKYAAARMTLTEQLLASARESLELANARYKVGSSSIVELSQAQLNETQAQIEQARARYDYQTRQAILRFQIGDLR